MHIHDDIISTIGATPIVRINNIFKKDGVTILAPEMGSFGL